MKKAQQEAKFQEKANEMAQEQLRRLSEQMDVFRNNLQEFASKYKKDIRRNPEFRRQFQEMCATVGVDPLQSSGNFWTKLLGVGDFYYELAVQILEVCLSTSHRNGGLMVVEELHERVLKSRRAAKRSSQDKKDEDISIDDLIRAIEKLSALGGGIKLIPSGKTFIVQSVASELSMDQTVIAQKALTNDGHVDKQLLVRELNWSEERATKALKDLVMEGIVWVDNQAPDRQIWYWFPGLF